MFSFSKEEQHALFLSTIAGLSTSIGGAIAVSRPDSASRMTGSHDGRLAALSGPPAGHSMLLQWRMKGSKACTIINRVLCRS